MAWIAPMTAVAGQFFTATQYNTYVRNNLTETMPAKATTAGSMFSASATNQITERKVVGHTILATEATTSTTYANLTTAGPICRVETGTKALVWFGAWGRSSITTASHWASVEVQGETYISPDDTWSLKWDGIYGGEYASRFKSYMFDVNPGVNYFIMKYRRDPSNVTGTYKNREMVVLPL